MSQHTNYLHKWLIHFLACLLPLCLFLFLQMCLSLEQISGSISWSAQIAIIWRWASPLTRMVRVGESRLIRFNVIGAFLQIKFADFPHCPIKWLNGLSSYVAIPLHIISSLCSYFFLFQNAILKKLLKLDYSNFEPFFSECTLHWLSHFFSNYIYLFELIFAS